MREQEHIHTISLVVTQSHDDEKPAQLYLLFRNHENQPAMQFVGIPLKRGDDTWSIRAVMDQPSQTQLDLDSLEVLEERVVFEGNGEVYLQKMALAADTAKYINDQNHDFDAMNIEGKSPNSVIRTLVEAMDLELPQDLEQYWIAGHQHRLVPQGWRSVYA